MDYYYLYDYEMSSNTTRIAKNTLMLYFRQILIMLVSLYTVRVVLETLGAEDYGIYNVVAGVVTMFGFLSGSMAGATQRYLSFELGRGDFDRLKKTFNLSFTIYIIIAILVLVLAETIGLWFISNKLMIPAERKNTALWIYQFSVISFIFTTLTTPYMAAIIAHENMNIYAYVSIIEALLKLVIVFLLQFITVDKLWLYGIMICIVTFINTAIYRTICLVKFKECKFKLSYDIALFMELFSYIAFNLIANISDIFKKQGINIILNIFFGPVINAAQGIATQASNAIGIFSNNFMIAVRPQIIKKYATSRKEEMLSLVFRSTKGAYFLIYVFVLPLFLEMPQILSLWLKNFPEYTVLFTRLILMEVIINSIASPLMGLVHATGRIKTYSIILAVIRVLNFPLSWLFLSLDAPAYSVFVILICTTIMEFIFRIVLVNKIIDFPVLGFLQEVILPITIVSIISTIMPLVLYFILWQSILRLFIVGSLSILSVSVWTYLIGINRPEREIIKTMFLNKIRAKNKVKSSL